VIGALTWAAAEGCTVENSHIFSDTKCGYQAPGLKDFEFTPFLTAGGVDFTKPMLLSVLCAGLVVVFFWFAFAAPKLVPGKLQSVGELGVLFVRDQILRPALGVKGDRFLPFLVSLFFFVWFMNIMGVIPLAQISANSRIAFPAALAVMVWITYLVLGIKHQGPIGYFRNMAIPQGAPWWILPLLAPIELLSGLIIRPFTLGVRLFANMFAGHLLLLIFSLATWYLLSPTVGSLFAVGSGLMLIVLTAFELLIQALQAYIFVTLTASYIAGSLEAAH
jgi:F-type H+-transporting ATPase subunit a